jgi:peptidyl-prolyl cis-trans isomerase B (cyclophilin B)
MKTSMGDIELELFEKEAPVTVANFISYVKDGFYKNTIFHRIIDNFMVQGGGFTEDFVQKETKAPIKNEADNQISNKKGTIAMARTSNPHSATCQFFINSKDNDFLDFKAPTPMHYGYCVFGKVVNGIEVIEKMSKVETGNRGFHQDVLIYREGYKLSPLDKQFITELCEAKRKFLK